MDALKSFWISKLVSHGIDFPYIGQKPKDNRYLLTSEEFGLMTNIILHFKRRVWLDWKIRQTSLILVLFSASITGSNIKEEIKEVPYANMLPILRKVASEHFPLDCSHSALNDLFLHSLTQ